MAASPPIRATEAVAVLPDPRVRLMKHVAALWPLLLARLDGRSTRS
jgi:hypothetical protein